MVKLWWKYSTLCGILRLFHTPDADNKVIEIINNTTKLSKKCFLYKQLQADDFLLDYTLVQNKKFDYDSPNDSIYLSLMNNKL